MCVRNEEIDIETSDELYLKNFQRSESHTYFNSCDFSEMWVTSLSQATRTLKNTAHKFLCSAVRPLSDIYLTDRVFVRKTMQGQWLCDTMNGRCKSMNVNHYAQIFTNKTYFAKVYSINSKRKYGDALKLFCQDFGVPEKLTYDASK